MGDFTVTGLVQIRPVDLYVTKGYRQNGVVLVGDAFRHLFRRRHRRPQALVDVERLCNVHIPRWLRYPGMGEAKISAFYDDPIKHTCDTLSEKEGFPAGPRGRPRSVCRSGCEPGSPASTAQFSAWPAPPSSSE